MGLILLSFGMLVRFVSDIITNANQKYNFLLQLLMGELTINITMLHVNELKHTIEKVTYNYL